ANDRCDAAGNFHRSFLSRNVADTLVAPSSAVNTQPKISHIQFCGGQSRQSWDPHSELFVPDARKAGATDPRSLWQVVGWHSGAIPERTRAPRARPCRRKPSG